MAEKLRKGDRITHPRYGNGFCEGKQFKDGGILYIPVSFDTKIGIRSIPVSDLKRFVFKGTKASLAPVDHMPLLTKAVTERLHKNLRREAKRLNGKYAAAPGLDLAQLRVANVARSIDPKGFDHPLDKWSIAEWTNAICGEAGEAANIGKKLIRVRKGSRGNGKNDRDEKKLLKRLAKEIADVVVYADLALASERIDLSEAVRKAWNDKAKEIGYDFKL